MIKCISLFIPISLFAALTGGCASNKSSTALSNQSPRTASSKSIVVSKDIVIAPKGMPNFTSEAAGFSIYFPMKPTEKRTQDTAKDNDVKEFRYLCKIRSVTYAVDAGIGKVLSKADMLKITKSFDYVQNGILKGTGSKLKQSRDIILDGTSGRQFTANTAEGSIEVKTRIYITPKFSYLIMAMGLKEDYHDQQDQIEKFFGSFRLTSQ